MQTRRFNFKDTKQVNAWLRRHKHPSIEYGTSPSLGFIVPGVAVGFLRRCEGQVGIIDGIATNPLVSEQSRHSALNSVYTAILSEPGFDTILGWTTDAGSLNRALTKGFNILPHVLLKWSR